MWYEIGIIQPGKKREGSYKYVQAQSASNIRKYKSRHVGQGRKIGSISKLQGKGKAWVHVGGKEVKKTVDWNKPNKTARTLEGTNIGYFDDKEDWSKW